MRSKGFELRSRQIAGLMAVLVVSACTEAGPAEPDGSMTLVAFDYLRQALDVMELSSVKRYEIDWKAFREQTLSDATGAETEADTYPAIVAALERLGDGHSFFRQPISEAPAAEGDDPTGALLGEIGYIDVPAFNGGGPDADELAEKYHRLIEGVDTLGVTCRWVVDLRGNTGGNMWPMVAGVGPILGADTVGLFVDPDSVKQWWIYGDGEARLDGEVFAAAVAPYALISPRPYVAVLTDDRTASSGEAVAVAFRKRADARSFGEPTWGVSTANVGFQLSDGAVIFLAVTTMADRLGTVYGGELVPDEVVVGGDKTGDPATDDVLDVAMQWLSERTCA